MKFNIQSITRYLLLVCGAAGFMAMTACNTDDQQADPPETEETEETEGTEEEGPDFPATPPPAPGQPVAPSE